MMTLAIVLKIHAGFQVVFPAKAQGFSTFLQFTRISLKSLIPKPYDFTPISVGDHIRKKRLQLGLFQREVAQQLGVNPWTIMNWERSHTEPPISAIPEIIRFLGDSPFPEPKSLPELLLMKRREMGWSIKEAARAVGVDPGTWGGWERGRTILYRQHRALITQLLDLPVDILNKEMTLRWSRLHQRNG